MALGCKDCQKYQNSFLTWGFTSLAVLTITWAVMLSNTIYLGSVMRMDSSDLPKGLSKGAAKIFFWIDLIVVLALTLAIAYNIYSVYKSYSTGGIL